MYQALAYCRAFDVRTAIVIHADASPPARHRICDGLAEVIVHGLDIGAEPAELERAEGRLLDALLGELRTARARAT